MKQSYATATVPDTAFTAIGLDARGTGPTPRSVVQPMELWASPFANGRVQLKWNRNGNTYATVFIIEAKIGENEWDIVGTTTQSKITLEGYEPGVTTSFRIFAKKGKQTAAPSNISLIYPPGGTSKRSIAA